MKKIYFVHQLNNFSGSPRVLSSIITFFTQRNDFEIHLLTSKSKGFLSDLNKNIIYHNNRYKWSANKSILLMSFLLSQLYSFFFILFSVKKNDIVYINTILPFMAAIAARLTKCKIIYHVHEIYLKPNIFQKLAYRIMYLMGDQIISVSKYVKSNLKKNP